MKVLLVEYENYSNGNSVVQNTLQELEDISKQIQLSSVTTTNVRIITSGENKLYSGNGNQEILQKPSFTYKLFKYLIISTSIVLLFHVVTFL